MGSNHFLVYCLLFTCLTHEISCQHSELIGDEDTSRSTRQKATKPNIVFMLADDLGYNDVGYHGSEILTPTIDYLANNGVKLENYYVQPMCTPSRGSLMTGRYPIHTGLQHEVIYAGQRAGLPLEMKTLAQELKGRGYATHGIGKWHLGFFTEEYLPTNRGFDSWKGYLTGNEDYYNHTNCESLGCGFDFRNNASLDYEDTGNYSTYIYTERARDIIDNHDVDTPLFLYMPYQAVHFPMQVPDSYIKPYERLITNKVRRTFAGMASCMDESIANVTSYLKERGMWENTILIFSTDNGGETSRGGNNWPLRGKKWTLWEGGVRGVAFVHSPLLNRPYKTVHESLMHISDWYPTIVEGILGESLVAEGSEFDGINMWDSIRDGTEGKRTEILHNIDPLMPHPGDALYNETFPTNTTAAIRVGDWKLLTGAPGVSSWFPPLTGARRRHTQWLTSWLERHPDLDVIISGNRSEKLALLDYDTSYHTAYDPFLPYTIERYDPNKWNTDKYANQKKNVWLFNIRDDPEEIIDLSDKYPDVVTRLLDRLVHYNLTAVTPNFPAVDPAGAPDLNNGTWSPWVLPNSTEESSVDTETSQTRFNPIIRPNRPRNSFRFLGFNRRVQAQWRRGQQNARVTDSDQGNQQELDNGQSGYPTGAEARVPYLVIMFNKLSRFVRIAAQTLGDTLC